MKEGDRVKLTTKSKVYEGILMPSSSKDSYVVKLSSGYNLGILKKKVKKAEVLKKVSVKKSKVKKHKHSKKKKTITILHTGGTIASKVDYETGAVSSKFSPDEVVELFPELEKMVNVNSRLLGNMFSEDMRFEHYNVMAKEIRKEVKKGVDAVIITQGTDTMHYTGAALSFILENLSIPVILVGAQRSSDRGSSDAAMNLIGAVHFVLESDCAGVALCMHSTTSDTESWILPGLKCRKMHTSRRDAFHPINAKPWAVVNYKKGKVKIVDNSFPKKSKNELKLKLFNDVKVGFLKIHPHMFVQELKTYNAYDGLLVEGTGLGHVPINDVDKYTSEHDKIRKQVKSLAKKMPVVMASQTLFGRVNMNVYSTGRELQDLGLIGNLSDMTPETSFVKLAWLLSNYPKKVKEMFSENLRGELNECIGEEFI